MDNISPNKKLIVRTTRAQRPMTEERSKTDKSIVSENKKAGNKRYDEYGHKKGPNMKSDPFYREKLFIPAGKRAVSAIIESCLLNRTLYGPIFI